MSKSGGPKKKGFVTNHNFGPQAQRARRAKVRKLSKDQIAALKGGIRKFSWEDEEEKDGKQ